MLPSGWPPNFAGLERPQNNASGWDPENQLTIRLLVFFAVLAVLAFVFAVALWRREVGPRGHGLEEPDPVKS